MRQRDGRRRVDPERPRDEELRLRLELARDDAHGSSRVLLLKGIHRAGTDEGKEVLEDLADDPALGKEARALLEGRAE